MIFKVIGFAAAFYAALVLLMYIFQRRLMYRPFAEMHPPEKYGLHSAKHIRITTGDNVTISSWIHPAAEDKETIVYFHGNLGNLGALERPAKFAAFLKKGFGLLAISYRGYGTSGGKPHEAGFYHDARAAIEYLHESGVPYGKMVFYGESLGSGIALQMATEYQNARGLVLEAPYTSVVARAAEIYPWIPVKYLLKDKFDSLAKIGNVKIPVLIMHGELDETIPIAHGRKLLEAARHPKKGIFYPHIHHIDFAPDDLAENISQFLKEAGT